MGKTQEDDISQKLPSCCWVSLYCLPLPISHPTRLLLRLIYNFGEVENLISKNFPSGWPSPAVLARDFIFKQLKLPIRSKLVGPDCFLSYFLPLRLRVGISARFGEFLIILQLGFDLDILVASVQVHLQSGKYPLALFLVWVTKSCFNLDSIWFLLSVELILLWIWLVEDEVADELYM